jgi:hypothetical protein
MPEDFSLGPLQSYDPAPGDEAKIFAVARSFLEGIAAGKLDESVLLPEQREALALLLAPSPPADNAAPASKTSPASGYRLGAIAIRGEDASLKVRLPPLQGTQPGSQPGSTGSATRVEGLLSLRKVDEAWYIEALALKPPMVGAATFSADQGSKAE